MFINPILLQNTLWSLMHSKLNFKKLIPNLIRITSDFITIFIHIIESRMYLNILLNNRKQ